jgi:hypothetical protein
MDDDLDKLITRASPAVTELGAGIQVQRQGQTSSVGHAPQNWGAARAAYWAGGQLDTQRGICRDSRSVPARHSTQSGNTLGADPFVMT